ncbi:MAG TPA: hypothetical protein VGT04_10270 [Acidobacteriaceae bacterium]|nr:hypothetical protein [Acidobacteriaceae bacterium]
MPFPIKVCVECGEEFELKPNKPGFANRCPECSEPESVESTTNGVDAEELRGATEINAARRKAIRDLLYRGEN